jgi:hypothetical protein
MFTLTGVPDGTRMAEARALGYAPTRVAVEPSRAEPRTVAIAMGKRVPTLDAVTVYGKPGGTRLRDLNGFIERQRRGFGNFLTPKQIDEAHAMTACDLLRRVVGLRVVDGASGCQATIRGGCVPNVFMDNMPYGGSIAEFSRSVSPREIMGIEVYSSATEPVQFMGGCGSIVVWTKR